VFGCACWPNLRPYNAHNSPSAPLGAFFLAIAPVTKGSNA
jgi:hypothetical protein